MPNGDDEPLDDTGDESGCDEPASGGSFPRPMDVLRKDREDTPSWLAGSRLDSAGRFLNSRVVFYPGSGTDGQAIKVFGGSRNAHCFVHADLSLSGAQVLEQLQPSNAHHVYGYHPVVDQITTAVELMDLLRLDRNHPIPGRETELKDALWVILRRDDANGEEHGPSHLAFLHICADAFWVFWNLWVRHDRPPHAILLQDCGFGGNYANFGGPESPMYRLANPHALPEWLLVAENTEPWPRYAAASDFTEEGGMSRHRRRLFRRVAHPLQP